MKTMISTFMIALRQLLYAKVRFMTALAGVCVAVMLMLVQLGIRDAAYVSALAIPLKVNADVVILSPRTIILQRSVSFPRRFADRARSLDSVESVTTAYIHSAQWKNPVSHQENPIRVYGYDSEKNLLEFPKTFDPVPLNRMTDQFAFDELSRPKFGPVAETVKRGERFVTEINGRKVEIGGLTRVGVAFEVDGSLFTGEANFLRLFPERKAGAIELAAITIKPGADANSVARELRTMLGAEAQVLTKEEFLQKERDYISNNAPIDFIFLLGAAVGLFVGGVVIYQILYTDVMNNLPQYATLKAIGFSDNYLLMIVMNECLIMSVLGYIPGFFLAAWIYQIAAEVTFLPVQVTLIRSVIVFALTTGMCCITGFLVMGKLRKADPADVF